MNYTQNIKRYSEIYHRQYNVLLNSQCLMHDYRYTRGPLDIKQIADKEFFSRDKNFFDPRFYTPKN